jgi:hypothetical protein
MLADIGMYQSLVCTPKKQLFDILRHSNESIKQKKKDAIRES